MRRILFALTLLFLSGSSQAQPVRRSFELNPETSQFAVLGTAKGAFTIDGKMGCMLVGPIKFSLPQGAIKPVHISDIRFGIAIPVGRNDWKPLSFSRSWPLNITLKRREGLSVKHALGCLDIPANLVAGQYWLFMQINFDDSKNHGASAYSATKEYWQLIDVPK